MLSADERAAIELVDLAELTPRRRRLRSACLAACCGSGVLMPPSCRGRSVLSHRLPRTDRSAPPGATQEQAPTAASMAQDVTHPGSSRSRSASAIGPAGSREQSIPPQGLARANRYCGLVASASGSRQTGRATKTAVLGASCAGVALQSELPVRPDDAEAKRLQQRSSRGSRPPLPLSWYLKPLRSETS